MRKYLFYILNFFGLLTLVTLGIASFFVRKAKMPQPVASEINIEAQQSDQAILSHQFLILITEKDASHLADILEPLGLRLKTPILNWLLVESKNEDSHIVALNAKEAEESRNILSALQQHQKIIEAHHNFVMRTAILPTNKNFPEEWHLNMRSLKHPTALQMPKAWETSQGSKNVSIAIVDDFLYQDLFTFAKRFADCASRVQLHEPFLPLKKPMTTSSLPHGELMLHALGACSNVFSFSTGIDWKAKLFAVQRPTQGHAQSFMAALYASNIDVCQGSIIECPEHFRGKTLGVTPDVLLLPFAADAPDLLQFTSDMLSAIHQQKTIVVTAAGNNQATASNFFPGGAPGVINVGSLNHQGLRSSFSNFGPTIDIFAPGEKINFFYPNGKKQASGTSLAAAFTAGAIALMKSVEPDLNTALARHHLKKSASKLSCQDYCQNHILKTIDQKCQELCCTVDESDCGRLALNIDEALKSITNPSAKMPLIELSHHYLMFVRNAEAEKSLRISNFGDVATKIKIIATNDNILIQPHQFNLGRKGSPNESAHVQFALKKEPFTRQTWKVELVAQTGGQIVDHAEVYLEYVPKK